MSQPNERSCDDGGGRRLGGWRAWRVSSGAVACLLMATMVLASCGGDTARPCESGCYFGVCDVQAGECVNADACQDDGECIPGYECGNFGTCEPINTCESTEGCSTGICVNGVCQNGEGCLKPVDCVARTFCADDNTCHPDRCYDKTCREGICQPSSGTCETQNACSNEEDCSAPERCIEGQCQTEEEFCSGLSCERGVCGFEAEGCVGAENCQGMDSLCLEGSFCNDETNQCQNDLCDENNIECGDNGVCEPGTGECENAESCSSNDDCLNQPKPLWCIQGSCMLDACGSCPGNQVCEYNPSELSAACSEPMQCDTSKDCTGDRECAGRPCLASTGCRADRFEPNDTHSDVTSFGAHARSGAVQSTLCSGDVDLFSLDPTDLPGPDGASQLRITVEIPKRDLGLGSLEVTLLEPDGTTVQTRQIPAPEDSTRAEITSGIPTDVDTQGRYRVRVEGSDPESLKSGGLYYELSAERISSSMKTDCDQAPEIALGQLVTGDLGQSSTNGFPASCGSKNRSGGQHVYRLVVDRPTEVQLDLDETGSGDTGITAAISGRCGSTGQEWLCENQATSSSLQGRVLGPGTYWVTVEAAGSTAGTYSLVVEEVVGTICSPETNYCSDGRTAQYCRSDGGGFEALPCGRGCEPSTGECVPPMGDVCDDAYQITSSQGRRADLRVVGDRYGVDPGGCLGDDPRTGGPDKAYRVVVPPGFAITVTAVFSDDVRGSVYLVEDCSSTTESCLAGAQGSRSAPNEEVVSYANSTSSPKSYYVIVDTAANQSNDTVDIAFQLGGATCVAGEERCTTLSNTVERCNQAGTGYFEARGCGDLACRMAACVAPNTCSTALDATEAARQSGGVQYDRNVSGLTDDYSFQTDCGGSGSVFVSNEPDAVYKVTLRAGEYLEATLDNSTPRMLLTEGSSCSFQNRCLASNQDGFTRTTDLTYFAAKRQDLYLLVGGSSVNFPVDINIKQSQCVLGSSTCAGSNVEYCNRTGSGFDTFNCPSGGCSGGFCNTKDSDFCYDAENLTSDASTTGGATRTIDLATLTNDIEQDYGAPCGSVSNFDTDGQDAVYQVDLRAGESITASLSSGGSFSDPALTLVGECMRPESSCVDSDTSFSASAQLTYVASDDETYYLIADHDGLSSNPPPFTLDVTIQ